MEYPDFLARRRELIASVIADGYKRLSEGEQPSDKDRPVPTLEELLGDGETTTVEFKSTLRVNLHTGQKDPRMELMCLKTIAAFLNSAKGGTLIIGVRDDATPLGIEADQFPNEDNMNLHLVNLINDKLGRQTGLYIHPRFEDSDRHRVLAVECWPSKLPVFVKDGNVERFYIRTGAATSELTASQVQQYIEQRFKR